MFPTQSWRACRPVSGLCHITHNLILNWRASSQFTPIRCSSNSSNSDGSTAIDSNSYLRHPEIAQREALRQFYLTFSPQEHIEVVQGSRDLLDVPTAIHMFCHAAELKLKGQLLGTISEQDQLSYQLYEVISDQIPSLPSQTLAAILWSMAAVQGIPQEESFGANPRWKEAVVQRIAAQESGQAKVKEYNTKEVINILYAVGVLCGTAPSQHVYDWVIELMNELAARVDSTPYVRGSLAASDYADLASVCARVFLGRETTTESSSSSDNTVIPQQQTNSVIPIGATNFMVFLAGEVRRQLANRHGSSHAAFLPRDLARFLAAFAAFKLQKETAVFSMFDVIAGFVVGRIRAKHLNAISRPDDIATVLEAYAQQQHRSVAVPELLTAAGEQLRRNAAQLQDQLQAAELPDEINESILGGPPDLRCTLPTLLSVLESHQALGFAPDSLTLTALLPGLRRSLADSSPEEVVQLFDLFEIFGFYPGSKMVDLMISRVEEVMLQRGGSGGRAPSERDEVLLGKAKAHAAAFLQGRG